MTAFSMPIRFVDVTWTKTEGTYESAGQTKTYFWQKPEYRLLDGTIIPTVEIGDVYFTHDHRGEYECTWSNCDGRHLNCVCPDDTNPKSWHVWDIDSRCSNCTMKDDRTHRCWVRTGDPRVPGQLNVGKGGHTCRAGAGSIAYPGFHGFLHAGVLKDA